jgi:hypothetical protein
MSYSKTIEHKDAFAKHLKSTAHSNDELQCINCFRHFATATALTQHCQSQGIPCKILQTSDYDGAVDGITAGTAITFGRHVDDTIKYAVNPEILPSLNSTGVVNSHKVVLVEKERRKGEFWNDRTARWSTCHAGFQGA